MRKWKKSLKEKIDDSWWDKGYQSPLEAALSNPDLLSEPFYGQRSRQYLDAQFALRQALLLLTRDEVLYVNFKAEQTDLRQVAQAMGVSFKTAVERQQLAVERLRSLAENILNSSLDNRLD